ncbi:DUF1810 domain-containing protein [Spirosoma fluminis]
MAQAYDLDRFVTAQEGTFQAAFNELKNGKKTGHWMWYIFPQIAGLGFSETSRFYAIQNLEEAELYLQHPLLRDRLVQIAEVLLTVEGETAYQIFGSPDDVKLNSCMTLFSLVENADPVFQNVIDTYFDGKRDEKTLKLVQKS